MATEAEEGATGSSGNSTEAAGEKEDAASLMRRLLSALEAQSKAGTSGKYLERALSTPPGVKSSSGREPQLARAGCYGPDASRHGERPAKQGRRLGGGHTGRKGLGGEGGRGDTR